MPDVALAFHQDLSPAARADLAQAVVEGRDERVAHFTPLRQRIRDMYLLVNNRWGEVFGRDLEGGKLPMVANDFQNHVEDVGNLFGAQIPTTRCYPDKRGDETAQRRAEDRENALSSHHEASRFWSHRREYGMDAAAAGLWAIRVWPDMSKSPEERFPRFKRLHPLNVLPEPRWTPGEENQNVMVQRIVTFRELERDFPAETAALLNRIAAKRKDRLLASQRVAGPYGGAYVLAPAQQAAAEAVEDAEGTPDECEVVDLWTSTYACRVAIIEDADEGEREYELLGAWRNPTGYCPVQCGTRSAWSLEPQGLMESAKGIVQGKNRFFQLVLAYATELVWGGRIVYGVQNPDASGVGARYIALTKDAFVRPVVAELNAQWASILGLIDSEGHDTAMAPRARGGEVDLNKATAAFLTKASGRLTSLVAANQDQFAETCQRANVVAQAIDETLCNTKKSIRGLARGRMYATTYTPSVLIAGDYSNVVDYGAYGGVDDQTRDIMIERQLAARTLSHERAIELNPNAQETQLEVSRLQAEMVEASLEAGFQLPGVPLFVRLRAVRMLKEGKSLEEVEDELGPVLQAVEQAVLGGGPAPGGAAGGPAPPLGPNGAPGSPAPIMPPREQIAALGR